MQPRSGVNGLSNRAKACWVSEPLAPGRFPNVEHKLLDPWASIPWAFEFFQDRDQTFLPHLPEQLSAWHTASIQWTLIRQAKD